MRDIADETMRDIADESEITLPVLKYGYPTRPLDWPTLIHVIQVEKDFDKLARNVDQQRNYMKYMKELKMQWRSVMDFVLCSKFDLERRAHNDSGLWHAFPPLSQVPGVHVRLVKNDFPYYLADNVEHWILWKLGQDCRDNDIENAKQELQARLGDVTEFLHWINPPHLKSLPEIDHAHIIICRTNSTL
mmetsp:Transcript_14407/g.18823  ORF Transcript_14407/g.18823 Transcript_14407/m.18823 type:complete len:189 (+) Transcript_14407:112-678(+)